MATCAVVAAGGVVENIIIADPAVDPAPPGYSLIEVGEGQPVSIGWIFDAATGVFTDPNPETDGA